MGGGKKGDAYILSAPPGNNERKREKNWIFLHNVVCQMRGGGGNESSVPGIRGFMIDPKERRRTPPGGKKRGVITLPGT